MLRSVFLAAIPCIMDLNQSRPSRTLLQRKENMRHILFKAPTYDTQMKKKLETSFEWITMSTFAEVLLTREQAGSDHVLSNQK